MVTLKLISSLIAITAHWESYMVDKLLAVFYWSVCKHILRKFFKEGLQIIYFISLAHPGIASCSLHTSVFTGTYMEYSRITSVSFWNSAVVVVNRSVLSDSCNPTDCSLPGSSVHGVLAGKNTGVCCHFLLQGIFLTQGLNPCLFLSPSLAGRFFTTGPQEKPLLLNYLLSFRELERRRWRLG